ncbi:hypothetical protein [Pseudonocardia acidicola]|uniref:Uncharacterized protein n=1 Tax=Pseudonocardia acidicola TaxID=2724939 RepID=A0ABX1SBL4_9PSEU|nr:hypothetical protein [Pseudonocardia acidicola]NMH97639.1 hypothetical protein [Pseudonocardia acidicola]
MGLTVAVDVVRPGYVPRGAGVLCRLVFAHIGRPSIRALDDGRLPPFGEWDVEGRTYRLGR